MVGTRNTPSQLSTFQMTEQERESQLEMTRPRPKISNWNVYMIGIILLLLCTVGVLVFFLVM